MTKALLLALTLLGIAAAQQPFQVKVTGHGKPMILIPGLSSAGETWDTTVAHYKDRYECHVLTVAGFAGVPRVPAPMMDKLREDLADYIRTHKLEKPVIVGHSLGGFAALDLAAHYPELPGRLVIVDSYPFFAGLYASDVTAAQAAENAAQMRKGMESMDQDAYERYVKSGMATRSMVTKDSDLDILVKWGLASDRTAVTDAMTELFTADLRDSLMHIKSPALVMITWVGYKQYTDREKTEANARRQYAKLAGAQIAVTDKARHFIMWDDPEWMFAQMDNFLGMK